ncbi:hypothetical protein [Ferruginibacter sp.]|nr:hypothetical protein [Ferruginibacter sp.]
MPKRWKLHSYLRRFNRQPTSSNGYDVAEIITCKACSGKGTVTSTFSHTNDYQYTLGQKHTYTKTTTSNCSTCGGNGFNYQ